VEQQAVVAADADAATGSDDAAAKKLQRKERRAAKKAQRAAAKAAKQAKKAEKKAAKEAKKAKKRAKREAKKKQQQQQLEAPEKKRGSGSSGSGSDDSSSSGSDADDEGEAKKGQKKDGALEAPATPGAGGAAAAAAQEEDGGDGGNGGGGEDDGAGNGHNNHNNNKHLPTGARAFKRVQDDEWIDKKGAMSNRYEDTFGHAGWGFKAQQVLGAVRGRDFRHEKTKKKRGSYRGGNIDPHATFSTKFDSE